VKQSEMKTTIHRELQKIIQSHTSLSTTEVATMLLVPNSELMVLNLILQRSILILLEVDQFVLQK